MGYLLEYDLQSIKIKKNKEKRNILRYVAMTAVLILCTVAMHLGGTVFQTIILGQRKDAKAAAELFKNITVTESIEVAACLSKCRYTKTPKGILLKNSTKDSNESNKVYKTDNYKLCIDRKHTFNKKTHHSAYGKGFHQRSCRYSNKISEIYSAESVTLI